MALVKDGSWTDVSLEWISAMRAQHKDLTPQELEKVCRKSCPFKERKGSPYKAWLKAMRLSFGGVTISRPGAKRCAKTADLFDGNAQ
jgi:hypothetical protein